jgi:hypothetical protein
MKMPPPNLRRDCGEQARGAFVDQVSDTMFGRPAAA